MKNLVFRCDALFLSFPRVKIFLSLKYASSSGKEALTKRIFCLRDKTRQYKLVATNFTNSLLGNRYHVIKKILDPSEKSRSLYFRCSDLGEIKKKLELLPSPEKLKNDENTLSLSQ